MITKQQALTLDTFHHAIYAKGADNQPTTCKIWRRNGQTQTWVTRPDNFRVPVKYGMYGYEQITQSVAHLVYAPSDCPACHGTKH